MALWLDAGDAKASRNRRGELFQRHPWFIARYDEVTERIRRYSQSFAWLRGEILVRLSVQQSAGGSAQCYC
jgi:hypothetical protein